LHGRLRQRSPKELHRVDEPVARIQKDRDEHFVLEAGAVQPQPLAQHLR
jgi:hypothetical protein